MYKGRSGWKTVSGRRPLVARNERTMETRMLKQTPPVRSVNSDTSLNQDQSTAVCVRVCVKEREKESEKKRELNGNMH